MKIKSLTLANYKRFLNEKTISFCNEDGAVNDVTLLVGDNGSGKSSVLQAVALLLGVTRPNFTPASLDWPGFAYEFLQNGALPVKVEALVQFEIDELNVILLDAIQIRHEQFGFEPLRSPNYVMPLFIEEIVMAMNFKRNEIFAKDVQYNLLDDLKLVVNKGIQPNVGSCFWYTEQRTSSSISTKINDGNGGFKAFEINELRTVLNNWYRFHDDTNRLGRELRPGQRDFYADLENSFTRVFPNRKFIGTVPKMDPSKLLAPPDFFLTDGVNQYELSGMSGGERAIFPLLIDFANWNINNSVILIDEVELHLHPPLQQAFVNALPRLGKNNQFIITTHSDYVASLFLDHQIIRL